MKQEKEIGYEITNVAYHNLEGFAELWNRTEADTKDLVVEENGRLAIKLAIPIVNKRWTYRSLFVGVGIGVLIGFGLAFALI